MFAAKIHCILFTQNLGITTAFPPQKFEFLLPLHCLQQLGTMFTVAQYQSSWSVMDFTAIYTILKTTK